MKKWVLLIAILIVFTILHYPKTPFLYPGDLLNVRDARFVRYLRTFNVRIKVPYRYVPLKSLMPLIDENDWFLTCSGTDYATGEVIHPDTHGLDFDHSYVTDKNQSMWKMGGPIPSPTRMVELATERGMPSEFAVLKLDFDGWECDVLEAFLAQGFRPAIVIIELNPSIPPPLEFAMHYDPDYRYLDGAPLFYGCSIEYATRLLRRYDYGMIQYVAVDGYFMRNHYLKRSALAPMDAFSVREHYRRGNPTFWGSYGSEKLGNVIKAWFDHPSREHFMGNLTKLHGELVKRGKFSLLACTQCEPRVPLLLYT